MRTIKNEWPQRNPYKIYPDTPGLLPWGGDLLSRMCFFLTEGKAEHWPIILWNYDGEYERFDMPMTSFLAKCFKNEIKCKIWEEFFSESKVMFEPD
jgi:hypothetical protein